MEDDIDTIRIKNELNEAQQSFHQTVARVNQKVASQLQPQHLVEQHLPLAAFIAGALGFAIGNRDLRSGGRLSGMATLVLGGMLGAALKETLKNGRDHYKTTK
jgi:ABC-type branched-subunit amino acid transport system permease subunit